MSSNCFYPTVCHVCKRSSELKKCSKCKLIFYCSFEHQRSHWPGHKKLCSSVGNVLKRFNTRSIFNTGNGNGDWKCIRTVAMCMTEADMKRQLTPEERQMFWFPSVCKVCHSVEIVRSLDCKHCFSVSYCCANHKTSDETEHSTICGQFKLCFELDVAMACESFKHPVVEIPPMLEIKTLPKSIDEFVTCYIKNVDIKHFPIIASQMLTCVSTILYSIEHIKVNHCNKLNIVLVGAEPSGPESGLAYCLEVLFHWLPNLECLEISFVGPYVDSVTTPSLCAHCSTKKHLLSFHKEVYHTYASSKNFSVPDIIAIFNCGFHETQNSHTDPWNQTGPLLFNSKLLTFFTSYTREEAEKDLARFLQFKPTERNISISLECVSNPFSTLRPHRDWENESVFQQNNFISIVRTDVEGAG